MRICRLWLTGYRLRSPANKDYYSFFTPYINSAINFKYGYVFAACCLAGAVIVYFFVPESQGRTLEEIDTMYISRVPAWKSSKWEPPESKQPTDSDGAYSSEDMKD